MLLQMTLFHSLFWLISHCIYTILCMNIQYVYVYIECGIHHIFIHSSVNEHLDCFHVLVIVNRAAMNTGVHASFWFRVLSGYMPRSGIAGSYRLPRSWWWTAKPGLLQSMGSQRVTHDWVTKLSWTNGLHKETACNAGRPGFHLWSGRSPGEENGNPLQYSCPENSMDGGAWQATVRGDAKSWTWLSD